MKFSHLIIHLLEKLYQLPPIIIVVHRKELEQQLIFRLTNYGLRICKKAGNLLKTEMKHEKKKIYSRLVGMVGMLYTKNLKIF